MKLLLNLSGKPFNPDIGDVLAGDEYLWDAQALVHEVKKRGAEHAVLLATTDAADPWARLGKAAAKVFAYECPWRGTTYYHFIPTLLSVPERVGVRDEYARTWWDICVEEFEKKQDDDPGLSGWARAWGGHGYTITTLPTDGDGEWRHAALKGDDGTIAFGYVWVWFNK